MADAVITFRSPKVCCDAHVKINKTMSRADAKLAPYSVKQLTFNKELGQFVTINQKNGNHCSTISHHKKVQ